ncbi:extensin-like isoform X2 [Mizuhopecten yessoensis]|uniref:extensin-like isoform X2 n=1 Tax=Mizuhopecten yessoensis TaxID=6573 RepID=UPI000B45C1A0|nr:extensin-like isoform X2 [Mizuhopecten yessoensis]
MRGAPSDVTGGELEFSESERLYGRGPGYSRIERSSETERRQSGNVESFGTVNLDRLRTDGLRGRQRTHQGTNMAYRDTRRVDSYKSGRVVTVPERRIVSHTTSQGRLVNRSPNRRLVVDRNVTRSSDRQYVNASPERRHVSPSPERRHVSPSPERYYVRETVDTKPQVEKVDKEVETCCCGCVEVVDSLYCCAGLKMFRCTCLDSEDEEGEEHREVVKQTKQPKVDKQYLFYRTQDRISDYSDSYTDETESDTYDEIDTKRLIPRPRSATYEKRVVSRDFGQSTRGYANVARSSRLMSRPRSAEHERYVRKVQPVQTLHREQLAPTLPPRPPVYERATHVSSKPPMIPPPTSKPAQRHVGVQMTTKYLIEQPKKKLVRNMGCQTVHIPSPPSTPSTSTYTSPSPSPVPTKDPSPISSPDPTPIPSPRVVSPPPSIRELTPSPEVEPLSPYEPAPIRYKTAIINIEEPEIEPQEEVLVFAKPPPRIEIPAPQPLPPPPVMYSIARPELYKNPDANSPSDPLYFSVSVNPFPVKNAPSPVISLVNKPNPDLGPIFHNSADPVYTIPPSKSDHPKRSPRFNTTEPETDTLTGPDYYQISTNYPHTKGEHLKKTEQKLDPYADNGKYTRPNKSGKSKGSPRPKKNRNKPESNTEPEVENVVDPVYYSVPTTKPLHSKGESPPPVVYRIIKPEHHSELEPEVNNVVETSHDPIPVKSHPEKPAHKKKKEEALLRPVPKGKSMMVRVGGGWMKVEHHRNHHIPLKVYEHQRDTNRDKFLFIKSRFATKKKYVPIAYRKYREEIVRDPWDPSVQLT